MYIPAVVDDQFTRVIEAAASPVFVIVTCADSEISARARKVCENAAEEYDDRVIFLRVCGDENPTLAALIGPGCAPPFVAVKCREDNWRIVRPVTAEAVADVLAEVCAR